VTKVVSSPFENSQVGGAVGIGNDPRIKGWDGIVIATVQDHHARAMSGQLFS
jgi:hypothetical protein